MFIFDCQTASHPSLGSTIQFDIYELFVDYKTKKEFTNVF